MLVEIFRACYGWMLVDFNVEVSVVFDETTRQRVFFCMVINVNVNVNFITVSDRGGSFVYTIYFARY